jgi:hypothetical protein
MLLENISSFRRENCSNLLLDLKKLSSAHLMISTTWGHFPWGWFSTNSSPPESVHRQAKAASRKKVLTIQNLSQSSGKRRADSFP